MPGLGRNTLPPISFGTGGGLAPGVESLPDIETRLLFVDKGSNIAPDGSRQEPFHDVASALAAAAALVPGPALRVVVLVYPGLYAESGLAAVDYVDIVGVGPRGAVVIEGGGAVIFTVAATQHVAVWNVVFSNTTANGIVTVSGAMTDYAAFYECGFYGIADNASNVTVTGTARALFENCSFISAGGTANRILVTSVATGAFSLCRRCYISGNTLFNTGSWTFEESTIAGNINSITPEQCIMRSCVVLPNSFCIYFHTQPAYCEIVNNRFVATAGNYDLDSSAGRTGFIIEGNVMTRGMVGYISHVKQERNVGAAGMLDWYPTVQAALDSCTFDDIVIRLLVDVTLTAALAPPASRTLTINGVGRHRITRVAANAIEFALAGQAVTLRDIEIRAQILINTTSAGCVVTIEDSWVSGQIVINSGLANTVLRIVRSEVFGADGLLRALQIVDPDPYIYIEWSRLKGQNAAGGVAVLWNVVTNNNLYGKHSKFWHGQGGANDPMGRTGVQTPTWHSHHDQFNSIPGSGWLTNLIPPGQAQDSVDPNADY